MDIIDIKDFDAKVYDLFKNDSEKYGDLHGEKKIIFYNKIKSGDVEAFSPAGKFHYFDFDATKDDEGSGCEGMGCSLWMWQDRPSIMTRVRVGNEINSAEEYYMEIPENSILWDAYNAIN